MAGVGAAVGVAVVKIVASTSFFKDGKAKGSVYAGAGAGTALFGVINHAQCPGAPFIPRLLQDEWDE